MWLHDEAREIPRITVETERVVCRNCGNVQRKYIKTWYSGGIPCVIKGKYCNRCGEDL